MRGVIVSVLKGEAGIFNNSLRREVNEVLRIRSSKLPAHFTIKSPFEIEDLPALNKLLSGFAKDHGVTPYAVKGYDHFEDRVIYMKMEMSEGAISVHDDLIDKLENTAKIHFYPREGRDKIFHVTVSSKKILSRFTELWDYVNLRPCSFEENFDNVSLFIWKDNTWALYKEYVLQA